MAKQTIGIGTTANDGTGDRLRAAMDKVNDNFNELYGALLSAFQTGTEAGGVFTLDCTTYKDWICAASASTTEVNISNANDGDAGMIVVTIGNPAPAAVAMGSAFTKQLGTASIDVTVSAYNVISWRKAGANIIYVIQTAE